MDELEYYATPGVMTELGPHAAELDGAGDDLQRAVDTVQGLLLHLFWAGAYGVDNSERQDEVQRRSAIEVLDLAKQIDARPLTQAREPKDRVLVNCRHFSTLTAALLRASGRPARARCGFANYFEDGMGVDHWVVEYWDGRGWKLADAQLDAFQRGAKSITFDPLDVPRGEFLVAGEAWRRCRAGEDDGNRYGILDMRGLWFVEGNVPRDLASLNKVELLPWDAWGVMLSGNSEHHRHDDVIDRAAKVTVAANFDELRACYEDELLRVPNVVMAMWPEPPREVRLR
jgi:hypothetical protein